MIITGEWQLATCTVKHVPHSHISPTGHMDVLLINQLGLALECIDVDA
jgi:hypothetical protein